MVLTRTPCPLELGRQMTMSACYACSDGLSSSYTRSSIVYRTELPKALAPWAEVPAAVRRLQAQEPTIAIRGFSVIQHPAFKMD